MNSKKINYLAKLLLTFAIVLMTLPVQSQYYLKIPSFQKNVNCSCYYDGYWGQHMAINDAVFYGDYHSFIIYAPKKHPSDYWFKFTIDNYRKPSKNEIKMAKKNNQFLSFTGTVEYYVNEEYPTIKEVFKKYHGPLIQGGTHPVKRVAKATIKIQPFKKHPFCYNFWFDDVGFAIFLDYAKFKK